MTNEMIVEAVGRVAAKDAAQGGAVGAAAGAAAVDPSAVARFQAAMGVAGSGAVDPVPFASEVAASWQAARSNNQALVHRIRALTEMGSLHGPASGELLELQYEVMNLSFQQEVVTKVADKSSSAIQTLIKNQ